MTFQITNKQARALWLHKQGLGVAPTGPLDLLQIVKGLGFVQLDTIQVVARAHHHILWSRNNNYREPMFDKMMRRRDVFEHFTHDASVIPMEFLPNWRRQMRRKQEQIDRSGWFKSMPDAVGREEIKERIRREGALSTHAFDSKVIGKKEMWARPPHKLALDYMWYTGELATCHRVNFTKFYDLAERVFPVAVRDIEIEDVAQIDWLCSEALKRLGFGAIGDIQRFWDAMDAKEIKAWRERHQLMPVSIQSADGTWNEAFAPNDIEDTLATLRPVTSRLRIINPFDPVIRDRKRLSRLFGFEYRIEMFVPAAKRVWGYYVYPILEGDKIVGRIEVKADRAKGCLNVLNLWQEPKIRTSAKRQDKLDGELARLARFVGASDINWHCARWVS